jgi:hypothetical protein
MKSSGTPPRTVLEQAEALVNGARRGDYGHPLDNFENIAQGFAVIFKDGTFTAEKVALAMDWVKTCRLIHTPGHRDSIVDKAGYTRTYELVTEERAARAARVSE